MIQPPTILFLFLFLAPLRSSALLLNCSDLTQYLDNSAAVQDVYAELQSFATSITSTNANKFVHPPPFGQSYVASDVDPNGWGGTNPDGAYLGFLMTDTDQTYPPGACDVLGKSYAGPACLPVPTPDPSFGDYMTLNHLQGERDVVVYLGCTPPGVQYWNFDVDINVRYNQSVWDVKTSDGVLLRANSWMPGQNFADPVNNINTQIDPSTSVPIAVLFSSDKANSALIEESIRGNGFENVFTVKMDASIYRPLRGNFNSSLDDDDSWLQSKPDMLKEFIRMSILDTDGPQLEQNKAYRSVPFGVAQFIGLDGLADTHVPFTDDELRPRDRRTDYQGEEDELGDAFAAALVKINDTQHALNFAYDENGTVIESFNNWGFYDDWEEVLAYENGTYVLGTRDAVYGMPADDGSIAGLAVVARIGNVYLPFKIIAAGVNHAKTGVAAQYHQYGMTCFTSTLESEGEFDGNVRIPTVPNVTISEWIDDKYLEGSGSLIGDDRLYYREFVSSADLCDPDHLAAGICVELNLSNDKATGIDVLTCITGSRTYANKENFGMGPCKDDMIRTRTFLYKPV